MAKRILILLNIGFFGLSISLGLNNLEGSSSQGSSEDEFTRQRQNMVKIQLQGRDITDPGVLEAMQKVKRHLFVASRTQPYAYHDNALPIEHNQTISQPYIVALMTQLAQIQPQDRVLEIGTGSGYQAAVLAELAKEVYSIEIIEELAHSAATRLKRLGYTNIHVRHGDGYKGWPSEAPFDAIIVTAAPKEVPQELVAQLKEGAKMVIPIGDFFQELYVYTKQADGSVTREHTIPVRFVPMVRDS